MTPRSGPGPVIGLPCNRTSPWSGNSRPLIMLINVVFPLPEKPTIATNSPSSTDKLMFSSTTIFEDPLPYDLETFFSSKMAILCFIESHQILYSEHDSVEHKTYNANHEHGHNDFCIGVICAILKFFPNE